MKEKTSEYSDDKVKKAIIYHLGLNPNEITEDMVSLKRMQLKLMSVLRNGI